MGWRWTAVLVFAHFQILVDGSVSESSSKTSQGSYEHLKRMFCAIPHETVTDPDVMAMGYRRVFFSKYFASTSCYLFILRTFGFCQSFMPFVFANEFGKDCLSVHFLLVRLSVSNNAADYSADVNLVVQDSKCMSCTKDFVCSMKVRICKLIIRGLFVA